MSTEHSATMTSGGIGQPVRRKEDSRLLTGNGCYTDDVNLPGQAYAVMVRSPHAHARIRSIQTKAALAMPGVIAVFTGQDVLADGLAPIPHNPAMRGMVDIYLENRDGSEKRVTPHLLLPADRARFVGEAVAVVVAESVAAAKDAAERVRVDYEPLPTVTATRAAAEPTASILWDGAPNNICVDADVGDSAATDAAFARAAHAVRLETWIQRVTGVPLEPRAAVCAWDKESGECTFYCGADGPVRRRRDLAAIFKMPEDKFRVIARDVGGNYGTRNWFYPEYGLVAWTARRLGRPVKWTADRQEAFLTDFQGRDLYVEAALALDAEGNFLALRSSNLSNIGAHTVSWVPLTKGVELMTSVYRFPAAAARGRAVMSNTSPTCPYRSAGRPEVMFVLERLIDIAARRCGFDQVELRRRNLVPASTMPYPNKLGLTYDSGEFERAMDAALALGDWNGFPARRAEAKRRGKLRGIGLAQYIEVTSGFPVERAEICVLPDEKRVDVVIGTLSSGQGHETSFAQCVSDWLGVPFEDVRLIAGDTARAREGGGSHSARSMRMAGIVMGNASNAIIARGTRIAAHALEAAEVDIEFVGGRFRVKGTDRLLGIFEVAAAAESRADLPASLRGPLAAESQEMMRHPGFPYGAQVCEVEIDPETGAVLVARYAAVDDVGRAINPMILHGQAHGGIAQGVGQALLEHIHYDPETGQLLSGSFMEYAMPRADTFPSFDTEIMEVPTPTNPLGVRGGGEGGTTPALAVVVNAIVDALSELGVEHVELPATPERVWRAIRDARPRAALHT